MGRDANSAPAPGAVQQFQGILVACRRESVIVMDAAFSDEPFKAVVLVGIKQAEEMHPVFGRGLEPAEGEYSGGARRLHKFRGVLDAVMIRDGDNLDIQLKALLNDCRVVVGFVCKRGLLVMTPQIGEGVYLQGAAIEARAIGQAKGLIEGCRSGQSISQGFSPLR